jgi:hypothetical protein
LQLQCEFYTKIVLGSNEAFASSKAILDKLLLTSSDKRFHENLLGDWLCRRAKSIDRFANSLLGAKEREDLAAVFAVYRTVSSNKEMTQRFLQYFQEKGIRVESLQQAKQEFSLETGEATTQATMTDEDEQALQYCVCALCKELDRLVQQAAKLISLYNSSVRQADKEKGVAQKKRLESEMSGLQPFLQDEKKQYDLPDVLSETIEAVKKVVQDMQIDMKRED